MGKNALNTDFWYNGANIPPIAGLTRRWLVEMDNAIKLGCNSPSNTRDTITTYAVIADRERAHTLIAI
jgi:hypothetical protein